jgi:hypothetical protein
VYIEPNSLTLQWPSDHPLAGLEMTVRSTSIGQMEEIEQQSIAEALAALAACVIGWNLESAPGEPAPVGPEALHALSPAAGKAVISGWFSAVWGASLPLDSKPRSGDGPLSPDTGDTAPQTLGLANLSASLPS